MRCVWSCRDCDANRRALRLGGFAIGASEPSTHTGSMGRAARVPRAWRPGRFSRSRKSFATPKAVPARDCLVTIKPMLNRGLAGPRID